MTFHARRIQTDASESGKTPIPSTVENVDNPNAPIDEDCGFPVESFACRIRHIQLNTGAAKAAND